MTPIPGKPKYCAESVYKECRRIIIDNFVYTRMDDMGGEWRCDKCKDYGAGGFFESDNEQLVLWEFPVEETEGYKFYYHIAQQHYKWAHAGDYEILNTDVEPSPEMQAILDAAIQMANKERDEAQKAKWFSTTKPKSKWDRFKAYFGFESYHGKHRREDFEDVAAVREVQRLWNTWHRTVTTEYRHYPLSTWQGRQCFQSDIQLARGYYPFKRKRHRKC